MRYKVKDLPIESAARVGCSMPRESPVSIAESRTVVSQTKLHIW